MYFFIRKNSSTGLKNKRLDLQAKPFKVYISMLIKPLNLYRTFRAKAALVC